MNRQAKQDFLVQLAFVLAVIGLVIFTVKYLLVWLLPFFLGFAIAFTLKPVTEWMCKYMKMRRRPAAVFAAVIFYLTLGILLWLLGVAAIGQAGLLLDRLPGFYQSDILPTFERINGRIVALFSRLSADMGTSVDSLLQSLNQSLTSSISGLSGMAVAALTQTAKKVPIYLLAVILTIVSSILICADYRTVAAFLVRQIPPKARPHIMEIKTFLVGTVGKMLRAYLLILGLTFAELAVGLSLLGVDYSLLAAAVVALLDILPFIGSGGILVPWALIAFLQGNSSFGAGLLCLYGIITVVRNMVEPKIVGSQIGLHPLVTVSAMFFGIKVLGVGGLLLGPIAALLLKHLNDTGALRLYR